MANPLVMNVDFCGVVGVIDLGPYLLNQFEITHPYHSSTWTAIKSSAKFVLHGISDAIYGYFVDCTDNYLPVTVYLDTVLVFKGYIRNNSTFTTTNGLDDILLELVGRTKDLDVTLEETITLTDASICDTSTPAASIIHQLLLAAGFGNSLAFGIPTKAFGALDGADSKAFGIQSADFSLLTDINITIDYYFRSKFDDHNIYKLIQDILFQAGYVLIVNASGEPYFASIIGRGGAPTVTTFFEKKIFKGFKWRKQDVKYDSVTAKYYDHDLLEKHVIFNDTTGGNDIYDCIKSVGANDAYPEDSDDPLVVTKLDFAVITPDPDPKKVDVFNTRDVIVAKRAGAEVSVLPKSFFEPAKAISADTWYGTSLDSGALNTTGNTHTLIQFQVIADVIVKGDMHEYIVKKQLVDNYSDKKFEMEDVTSSVHTKVLCDGLLDNYVYGKKVFNFETTESLTLGGYYTVTDGVYTGVDYNFKVIKKTPVYRFVKLIGLAVYYYKYEALSYGVLGAAIDTDANDTKSKVYKQQPRVFRDALFAAEVPVITNPEPPYFVGDLWIKDDGNRVCDTLKATGAAYDIADWPLVESNVAWDNAEIALGALADMADDDRITPVEKLNLNREWNRIDEERKEIVAEADDYGVDRTDYMKDFDDPPLIGYYNYLRAYLIGDEAPLPVTSGILTDLTTTSDISHATFNQKFADYYFGFSELSVDVADAIKTIADGKITTFYAATGSPPTAEGDGDMWYNTTTGVLKRWDTDEDPDAWVELPMSGFSISADAGVAFETASKNVQILNNGTIKAINGEFVGTLKTGANASLTARVAIRDASGITVPIAFTGTGVDDMYIAEEGAVAGEIEVVIVASKVTYDIGDTGPGGGYIFYKSNANGVDTYLECAPAAARLSGKYFSVVGAHDYTSTAFGSGQANTTLIKNKYSGYPLTQAVWADALTSGGKSDWFIPSYGEASYIKTNLMDAGLGGFSSGDLFFTSSEGSNYAYAYRFGPASWGEVYFKPNQSLYTLPIREFSVSAETFKWKETSGAYSADIDLIAGVETTLTGYDIKLAFSSESGHVVADKWEFTQGAMRGLSIMDSSGVEYLEASNGVLKVTGDLDLNGDVDISGELEIHKGIIGGVDVYGDLIEHSTTEWTGGSQAIAASSTWTPPAGTYTFAQERYLIADVYVGAAWRGNTGVWGGTFICDGTNMRIVNTNIFISITAYYRKKP